MIKRQVLESAIYNTIRKSSCEIPADVRAAISLLQWDQETYMPLKGGPSRGYQIATLSA
jgi:Zn-dependent M32 family carboxypeptidase